MAYPDTYEDCSLQIEPLVSASVDAVDYDRIQAMVTANGNKIDTAVQISSDLKEYTIDTNFKLSSLLKKWTKRGW